MLNTARNRFTAASRSIIEECGLSTAARALMLDVRAGDENERDGDHDVHQRAGDGDQEFLARLLGDALEPRHAADRQQRHVRRRDAERARREDVAELVRQHAGKQQDQEGESLPRRFRTARRSSWRRKSSPGTAGR